MALIVRGKSTCPLCGKVMQEREALTSFPAFLPAGHHLATFSDASFHRACFDAAPQAARVTALHERFASVWNERPRHLRTAAQIDAWTRDAFARLWNAPEFRVDAPRPGFVPVAPANRAAVTPVVAIRNPVAPAHRGPTANVFAEFR